MISGAFASEDDLDQRRRVKERLRASSTSTSANTWRTTRGASTAIGTCIVLLALPAPLDLVLRDFGMMVPKSSGRDTAFCSVMKFPPLAMLLTDAKYFHGLPDLCAFSHFGGDDPGRVHLSFSKVRLQDWPEGTDHSGFIVTDDSGTQPLHGTPRRA